MWGDLEDGIPIVVPQAAEQPTNLKLTLLPFQKESLFWMRKQEKGIWHGGMLAVCVVVVRTFTLTDLLIPSRTRWGKACGVFSYRVSDPACRMGKTIQIIALFVSDNAKPNLVVAYVCQDMGASNMNNNFIAPLSQSCNGGTKLRRTRMV